MKTTSSRAFVAIAALLLSASGRAETGTPLPDGVSQAWLEKIKGDVVAREYGFALEPRGSAAASNGAHEFDARVAPAGIELRGSEHAVRLDLRLVRFGREGALVDVPEGRVEANRRRAEIHREGVALVEWYENAPQGLEQGWDLATRPAGDHVRRAVLLELATIGGLRPELRDSAQNVAFLDARGAEAFRYGGLVVRDARGERLPSTLALAGLRVQIRVEDAGAEYPLVIDPVITTPSWDPESNIASASFGVSVSTAGDFNGDGYSDVIVGSPGESLNRGRVYLYLGGAGGPDEIADSTFQGISAWDYFGASVAAAGNVNNDAFDDVVVGAPGDFFQSTNNAFGRIAVFLGRADGVLDTPQTASDCFNAVNPPRREGLGRSVAGAGDVNMDGFDDVIAGGSELAIDLNRSGVVCVYPGSGSGILTAAASVVRLTVDLWPTLVTNHAFGASVSGAGDVNGDGFADIVVGAPGARGVANQTVGAAFVFHGPLADGDAPDWTQLGDNRSTATFPASDFGAAVADAGDLNGDGFADIAVGAPGYDQSSTIGGDDRGAMFLFHGSAGGIATPVSDCDVSDFYTDVPAQYCEFGIGAAARMGAAVATAGDLNGDGLADVVFIQPNVFNGLGGLGAAHIIFGSTGGNYVISTPSDLGSASAGALAAVATAGDTDRDGFSEVLLGVPGHSNGQFAEGQALLFRSTGDMPLAAPNPVSWSSQANQPGANLFAVSAGDINADGFTDIVTGWPGYDGCGLIFDPDIDEGTIFVSYGGSCGPACSSVPIPLCSFEGNEDGANVGLSVSATGDVNGDGFADVLVGGPGHDASFFPFPADTGRAYLYLGGSFGLNSAAASIVFGGEASAQLGYAVSIVGDVNGDGRADAMIGEPNSNEVTGAGAGSAHLYYGTPTGLTASPVWSGIGTGLYAQYGSAIAGAGDVNRDGYADVVIGAPGTNNSTGEAYVYLGGAQGLATSASRTYVGDFAGAELGAAVGSGGDVNGDGFSEVLVGSPGGSRVVLDTGVSLGFLNGPGGSRFGGAVGSAGDVNGDGFSDLAIGAHWEDAGAGFAQGRVHLFLGPSIQFTADRTFADCPHSFCDYGVRLPGPADVNGDGFGDLVTTAFKFTSGEQDEGGVFMRFGNGVDGVERTPRQLDDIFGPIRPVGNASSPSFFRVWAQGSSAAGRAPIRLDVELKALATPFDGLGVLVGSVVDSGVAGTLLGEQPACTTSTPCKWRARVRSRLPHFPGSPWLSPPENARTEADLRLFRDFDADAIPDPADTCPTQVNSSADSDMDGVDQACDTCSLQANPVFGGTLTNRTRISGQLDDDADGRGNRCDFDYNNVGAVLTSSDFNDMKFSLLPSPGLMTASSCGATVGAPPGEGGSGANQRCGEFDHDGSGAVVSAADFNLSRAAVAAGGVINTNYPKCSACTQGTGWSDVLGPGARVGRPVCQSTVGGACVYAP